MKKLILLLTTIAITFLMTSCMTSYVMHNGKPAPSTGRIVTDGVVISDEKGEFELRSGETFQIPFAGPSAGVGMHNQKADMVSYYQIALDKMNAKRVRVKVPSLDEPLYGVLLFSYIYPGGSGPAIRSCQIHVPDQYINAALGGRISVVYERYPIDPPKDANGEYFDAKSWILWLSDMPF